MSPTLKQYIKSVKLFLFWDIVWIIYLVYDLVYKINVDEDYWRDIVIICLMSMVVFFIKDLGSALRALIFWQEEQNDIEDIQYIRDEIVSGLNIPKEYIEINLWSSPPQK